MPIWPQKPVTPLGQGLMQPHLACLAHRLILFDKVKKTTESTGTFYHDHNATMSCGDANFDLIVTASTGTLDTYTLT